MANPVLGLYTTGAVEVTAINYGTGDAGEILPTSTGTLYYLWNDKGGTSTSDTALNIKARVRDADGNEEDPITTQQWIEIKSTTLHAGSTGASVGSYTDDNMSDFQPIGEDAYVTLGGIPSDCYRKVYVRCNIPPGASQTAVTFSLYFDYQDPSASIANWITGVHGNGVIASTGEAVKVTDSTGADSVVTISSGYVLLNNNEVTVYGQNKTLSTGAGTYNVYVTVDGVISYSTGAVSTNALGLAQVVISSGQVTTVTDKRVYIGNVVAGTTGAMDSSPVAGNTYLDVTNKALYHCYTATGGWEEFSGGSTETYSTATAFTELTDTPANYTSGASKLLRVNSTEDAIEFVSATGLALDGFGTPSTGTDLNASTSRHGLLPILTGSTSAVLIGNGTWSTSFSAGGGSTVSTFLDLTDSPAAYSSAAGYLLRVNSSTDAVEFVSSTGIALDSLGTPSTGTGLNASTSRHGLLPKLTGSTTNYLLANGTWAAIPGSTGGEANTAANVNTTGVGVYQSKSGVELRFKGIHSTGHISVTNTTGTYTINLDVVTTGITLNNLDSPIAVTTGNVVNFGAHSAGFTEQAVTPTTGAVATVNWSNGNKAVITRSTAGGGAVTVAMTNPPKSMSLLLIVKGSTAGCSGSVAWSTGNSKTYWSSTATPTFSTGVSSVDVVGLYYSTGLGGYLASDKTAFSTV